MFRHFATVFHGFVSLEMWARGEETNPILVVRSTDSCSGLLYDRTRKRILLVRQNRAPMVRGDNPDGSIVELVAGRFDRAVGAKTLFVAEAKEEAGANITIEDVELLNDGRPMAPSPGILTERCYLAFVEIREEHLDAGETFGIAAEHEVTTRHWMPVDDFLAGPHDDLRVYTLARELECRLLRKR